MLYNFCLKEASSGQFVLNHHGDQVADAILSLLVCCCHSRQEWQQPKPKPFAFRTGSFPFLFSSSSPKSLYLLKLCIAFPTKSSKVPGLSSRHQHWPVMLGKLQKARNSSRSEKVGWLVRKPGPPFTELAICNLDLSSSALLSCSFHDSLGILPEP